MIQSPGSGGETPPQCTDRSAVVNIRQVGTAMPTVHCTRGERPATQGRATHKPARLVITTVATRASPCKKSVGHCARFSARTNAPSASPTPSDDRTRMTTPTLQQSGKTGNVPPSTMRRSGCRTWAASPIAATICCEARLCSSDQVHNASNDCSTSGPSLRRRSFRGSLNDPCRPIKADGSEFDVEEDWLGLARGSNGLDRSELFPSRCPRRGTQNSIG